VLRRHVRQSARSALDSATLCCGLGCVQELAVAGAGCSEGAWAQQVDGGGSGSSSSGDMSNTTVQHLAYSALRSALCWFLCRLIDVKLWAMSVTNE
jgi:hypothetical protein